MKLLSSLCGFCSGFIRIYIIIAVIIGFKHVTCKFNTCVNGEIKCGVSSNLSLPSLRSVCSFNDRIGYK
jgi:hypothetical protein